MARDKDDIIGKEGRYWLLAILSYYMVGRFPKGIHSNEVSFLWVHYFAPSKPVDLNRGSDVRRLFLMILGRGR